MNRYYRDTAKKESMLHINMKNDIETIKERITPVLRIAGVQKAALFGSCARGDMSDSSDIDILVQLPEKMSLLQFIGLKYDLEDAAGCPVDVGEYDSIKPRLKKTILADHVEIL